MTMMRRFCAGLARTARAGRSAAIVARFFIRSGVTADIGCGSGREVAWLNANGFPAVGFDASKVYWRKRVCDIPI